jgi:hypothetical protein
MATSISKMNEVIAIGFGKLHVKESAMGFRLFFDIEKMVLMDVMVYGVIPTCSKWE